MAAPIDTFVGITRTLAIKLEDEGSRYSVEDVRDQWREYVARYGPTPWGTWLRASGWLD